MKANNIRQIVRRLKTDEEKTKCYYEDEAGNSAYSNGFSMFINGTLTDGMEAKTEFKGINPESAISLALFRKVYASADHGTETLSIPDEVYSYGKIFKPEEKPVLYFGPSIIAIIAMHDAKTLHNIGDTLITIDQVNSTCTAFDFAALCCAKPTMLTKDEMHNTWFAPDKSFLISPYTKEGISEIESNINTIYKMDKPIEKVEVQEVKPALYEAETIVKECTPMEMNVKDGKLTIIVDINQDGVKSASGKSTVIESTRGNIGIPGTDLKIGLNIYRPIRG
jgi:hypothetical protein